MTSKGGPSVFLIRMKFQPQLTGDRATEESAQRHERVEEPNRELVAAVEAVGEFGKIARRIFLTPGVVGAVQTARLTLPLFTHPSPGKCSCPSPPSVTRGRYSQPASTTNGSRPVRVRVDHRLKMRVGPGRNLDAEPFHADRNATGRPSR